MTILWFLAACSAAAAPHYLEDRFEMPPGFRIYRAAGPDLCGGSYDIAFDGEGRLLVGDGAQVRRLLDQDGDGTFDRFEVIATGLGSRGPQGLLIDGDRLFAVGGDGIQLFEGYRAGGPLVHRGRIGSPFGTGGDHDAHTILRGHDGYLYFITGDGGGARDRRHITEETSPALFERSCSVFRISPDGKRWECIGSGGRNSPNLGVNYLGEFFSFDSDMEWHVELPWWRPVRLHHWTAGGDQGWQGVGAYPPYYIDNLPGIADVGRGSPDWGVFYEHSQLPAKYRDAYLVCDYLSKSATTGGYETSGRLFAFFLAREGAGWKATQEVLARPRPGARDPSGRKIDFALVDIEVAPDGSLLLSDHNQGVWRILHEPGERPGGRDGGTSGGERQTAPPMAPPWPAPPADREQAVDALLDLPQPGAEWSRLREEELMRSAGSDLPGRLGEIVLDPGGDPRRRLRALRAIAPGFADLPAAFLEALARDRLPELRGQAAWLLGLGGGGEAAALLETLLDDPDPFVRRRAAEALSRRPRPASIPRLLARLGDPVRLVRYTAMTALAHLPPKAWLDAAVGQEDPQIRMRALVACSIRREPPPREALLTVVNGLLDRRSPGDSKENRLDLLRILGLFGSSLREDPALKEKIGAFLVAGFPDPDPDVRRELARLLGEYRVPGGFGRLLAALEGEPAPVEQFHLAQALARIREGWSFEEEERAIRWFLGAQKGWFAEFSGKGLEFPHFWSTVLAEFAAHHRPAVMAALPEIDLSGLLGGVAIDLVGEAPGARETLIAIYRANQDRKARRRILGALGRMRDLAAGKFLREEYLRLGEPEVRGVILQGLARGPAADETRPLLEEGLLHPDPDVVRASAAGLAAYPLEAGERLTGILLGRLIDRADVFHAVEKLLVKASGARRPGFRPDAEPHRRPEPAAREAALGFWKGWYAERFKKPFEPPRGMLAPEMGPEMSDEELRSLLLGEGAKGGDAGRGRKVYEAARCAACHGGGEGGKGKGEGIFGPDLAGVTRRLKKEEIADSLVYPSKQVADRFKAMVVQVRGAPPVTGFVTEENEELVTLVDPERVHRIPRKKIGFMAPQESSLMPERLLNRLSAEEVRDLMAFLDEVGARPEN